MAAIPGMLRQNLVSAPHPTTQGAGARRTRLRHPSERLVEDQLIGADIPEGADVMRKLSVARRIAASVAPVRERLSRGKARPAGQMGRASPRGLCRPSAKGGQRWSAVVNIEAPVGLRACVG
jgi:hypothetical protein